MRVGLLGPVVVEGDGLTTEVRGARQQALLAILALHAGEVVGADRLVDELWGEAAPANPANALQAVVSRVRRVLDAGALTARGTGYALELAAEDVDAIRFEHLVSAGRARLDAGDAAAASAALADALRLWRGPALGGLADQPSLRAAAVRLGELRGAALDAWADAELALGRHEALVPELRGAVEADPLREGTWVRLLLALYRSGRQAEALRAYQQAREVLADQLGVEPGPELRATEAAILGQSPHLDAPAPPLVAGSDGPRVRRPRTTFLGREGELDAVGRHLADAAVVTLLGPGGMGKTRLATEVASRRDEAGERVAFVDLAAVAAGEDVAEAFAIALGGRDQAAFTGSTEDALQRAVAHAAVGPVLVVVDNCEHVVDDAARAVEAIIGASDGVRVLATSREGLGVPGEHLHPLGPLAVEDGVALFVDRARAVHPGFAPTSVERDLVGEICARLDGLPLAIELAAARTRALPVGEIATRLDDRFRLLTHGARTARPRQQTLRAVVDWSHDLLGEEERHVFARLSVFVGGFGLDDAAAVAGGEKVDEADVAEVVLRLVDKSLVTADVDPGAGTARFGLLQTLAEYAGEKLAASGDRDRIRERHTRHFAAVARALEPALRGAGQRAALDRLELEHENLRAALERSIAARDADLAHRLAGDLGWFWYLRGHVSEGARWSQLVRSLPTGDVEVAVLARSLRWGTLLCLFAGEGDVWGVDRTEELARRSGDRAELASTLAVLSVAHARTGDTASAAAALDEMATIGDEIGDRWAQGTAAVLQASLLGNLDVDGAHDRATGAIGHFRAQGDDWGLSLALMVRATSLEARGDYDAALADFREAHAAAERLASEELAQHFLIHTGNLSTLAGDAASGRRSHERAAATARRVGSTSVLGMALNGLGLAARRMADLTAAADAYEEARDLYASGGWTAGAALAHAGLGFTAEESGDADAAERHHRRSLQLARLAGDERAIALAVEGLAGAAALRGDHERAALLLGHAAGRRAGVGAPLPPGERVDVERTEAAVTAAIGARRRDELLSAGVDTPLDDLLPR